MEHLTHIFMIEVGVINLKSIKFICDVVIKLISLIDAEKMNF